MSHPTIPRTPGTLALRPRRPWAASALAAIASLAALAVGCGPDATGGRRVVNRLVDATADVSAPEPRTLVSRDEHTFPLQTSAEARIPSATIDDETRYVLATHEKAVLAFMRSETLGTDGRIQMRVDLGLNLAGAQAIVASPVARAGEGEWNELPAQLLPVRGDGSGRFIEIESRIEAEASAGSRVQVTVFGHRPPGEPATRLRTAPAPIPAQARLDFGFGVLEPARGAGPVRFAIESCAGEECREIFAETLSPDAEEGS